MTKYVVRRLFLGLLTVLAVALLMFIFEQIVPDKPYSYLLRTIRSSSAQDYTNQINALKARFGYDQPFYMQFLFYLRNLLHPVYSWFYTDDSVRQNLCAGLGDTCNVTNGFHLRAPLGPDFGYSQILHQDVWQAITDRVGATAELMGSAYLVTLVIAVPLGIVSAVRQHSRLDNTLTSASFIGISLPNYWFGTILVYLFAILPYQHGLPKIFPASGQNTTGLEGSLPDLAWHLVLPVTVLAVQQIAGYQRYIRASMLEVLSQDYIRTARAKGLADRRVVLRHALRNSLLPFITLMGLDIPQLFVGAVITEFVFSWPGMGQLFVNSAGTSDFPILTGIALVLSAFVVVGNLTADLAYSWADPRIAYD
ncbi:MAG TPA: ABC transporter permease [Candidatus Dormibacteraeota bacterium]|nr:ABC transporter permease [Candidatus Dormibacteraeota bacterium]